MDKRVILLVDDDVMSAVYSSLIIKKQNPLNEIISFHNGLEALGYLANTANIVPDVIFLDLNMPGMNGWDFLEEYEKTGLTIDIIVVTSSDDILDKEKCRNYKIIKEYFIKAYFSQPS